ncbi:MAG: hypothetical protein V3S88_04400, partial [Alphaproteobacteria bacterium]
MEPFDRDDFAVPFYEISGLGAYRMAMWGFQILETGKAAQRRHGAKEPGLRWGKSAPRVRCDAR